MACYPDHYDLFKTSSTYQYQTKVLVIVDHLHFQQVSQSSRNKAPSIVTFGIEHYGIWKTKLDWLEIGLSLTLVHCCEMAYRCRISGSFGTHELPLLLLLFYLFCDIASSIFAGLLQCNVSTRDNPVIVVWEVMVGMVATVAYIHDDAGVVIDSDSIQNELLKVN